jgi:hypothetical protein
MEIWEDGAADAGPPPDYSLTYPAYTGTAETGDILRKTAEGWEPGAEGEGPAGDSAYEVAVANGFVGTEVEWLASLVGSDGADGAAGAAGADGADGADGATGAAGADGADGASVSPAGSWANVTAYAVLDLVENGGSSYVCTAGHTSSEDTEPGVGIDSEDFWQISASKGDTGATGGTGDTGATGATGAAGADGADGADGAPGLGGVAASDESTALTASSSVPLATFHTPRAGTWTEVLIGVTTAPTGSTLTADVRKNGTTIFSTKPTIDAAEKTSVTAAAAAVISSGTFAKGDLIELFCDSVGASVAGAGLKFYFTE